MTRVKGHNDCSAPIDCTLDDRIIIGIGSYWAPEPIDADAYTPRDQLVKKGDQVSIDES